MHIIHFPARLGLLTLLLLSGTRAFGHPPVACSDPSREDFQNQPPIFYRIQTSWVIPNSVTSTLWFEVSDDGTAPEDVQVTTQAAHPGLLPNLAIQSHFPNQYARALVVTPAPNQTGSTTLTLTATDATGLSSNFTLAVTVRSATPVVFADANLEGSIRATVGNRTEPLTTLDLDRLTNLSAESHSISNLSGLEWATNLSTLVLSYNSIRDLTPLAKLANLKYLNLSYNPLRDLRPLSGLTNLESLFLTGNPIRNYVGLCELPPVRWLDLSRAKVTDLHGLACLTNLSSLGLAGNDLSDPSPLIILTNLQSLDLTDNPLTNCTRLSGFTNLAFLNLVNTSLTSLEGLTSLPQLSGLGLFANSLTNLAPLAGLTNLLDLDLGRNPLTNYSPLATLTNLDMLSLSENNLRDLGFLRGFTWLSALGLARNQLDDLQALAGLTNLISLDVGYNRLTNIALLQELPQLRYANLCGNLLDLSPNSAAMEVIQHLQDKNVSVYFTPQNQPPHFQVPSSWRIGTNEAASLLLYVYDDATLPAQLVCTVTSSNPQLVPQANLRLALDASELWPGHWGTRLTLVPAPNQTGTTTLTLTATDSTGLSNSTTILVQVIPPQPLAAESFTCSNLLWQTLGTPPWEGQTNVSHDGVSAGRSGGPNSWAGTTVTGPGTLAFWWKSTSPVSWSGGAFTATCAESSVSGGCSIQADNTWRRKQISFPEGTWVLRWSNASDPSWSTSGSDSNCLWLDEVSFAPGPPVCWVGFFDAYPTDQPWLTLHGQIGATYHLEASSDLTQWSVLTTRTLGNFESYHYLSGFSAPLRFYRLHQASPPASDRLEVTSQPERPALATPQPLPAWALNGSLF